MSICQDIINTNNALRENSSTQGQVQYDTLIAKINAQDTQMQNAKMLMISLNAKADAMLQKANDILESDKFTQTDKYSVGAYIAKIQALKQDYHFAYNQIEKRQLALKSFLTFAKDYEILVKNRVSLEAELTQLQSQLAQLQTELQQLINERQPYIDELARLDAELINIDNAYNNLGNDLESKKNQIRELGGIIPPDNIVAEDRTAQKQALDTKIEIIKNKTFVLQFNSNFNADLQLAYPFLTIYQLERQSIICAICTNRYLRNINRQNANIQRNQIAVYNSRIEAKNAEITQKHSDISQKNSEIQNAKKIISSRATTFNTTFMQSQKALVEGIDLSFDYRAEPKATKATPIKAPLTSPQRAELKVTAPSRIVLERGQTHDLSQYVDSQLGGGIDIDFILNNGVLQKMKILDNLMRILANLVGKEYVRISKNDNGYIQDFSLEVISQKNEADRQKKNELQQKKNELEQKKNELQPLFVGVVDDISITEMYKYLNGGVVTSNLYTATHTNNNVRSHYSDVVGTRYYQISFFNTADRVVSIQNTLLSNIRNAKGGVTGFKFPTNKWGMMIAQNSREFQGAQARGRGLTDSGRAIGGFYAKFTDSLRRNIATIFWDYNQYQTYFNTIKSAYDAIQNIKSLEAEHNQIQSEINNLV